MAGPMAAYPRIEGFSPAMTRQARNSLIIWHKIQVSPGSPYAPLPSCPMGPTP